MKTLITRIKRLALALCLATPIVSWADAITAVNPVTGASDTYTYKYVGTEGTWTAADWEDADGNPPAAVPQLSGEQPEVWDSLLISGDKSVTAEVEGWTLDLGLFDGANLTMSTLHKFGGGCSIKVDSTSKLTISALGTKTFNGDINYYVAAPEGITYGCDYGKNGTFYYYFTGDGSVAYQNLTGGNHTIKAADITLSAPAEKTLETKTLVSFSNQPSFGVDAAITIKDSVGTVVNTVYSLGSVTATAPSITTADPVGSYEFVKTASGIVLYYVDGDPAEYVAPTYTPSINVNFTYGTGYDLTTRADVGLAGYAVPGSSWNNIPLSENIAEGEGVLNEVKSVDSTGSSSVESGVTVTVTGARGSYYCWSGVAAASDPRHGYIDEGDNYTTPTITVTGVPYDNYRVVVYCATDTANAQFGYVTVNGVDCTYVDGRLTAGTTSWGNTGANGSALAIAEGVNTLVSDVLSGPTATVAGNRMSATARGCIAAIQIVEVDVGGALVIPVSGDTEYPVSADQNVSSVKVIGSGTLTFTGEGTITAESLDVGPFAVVNMGSNVAPTTVTGSGTVVYDGVVPPTGKGWTESTWTGTVWLKNKSGITGNNNATTGVQPNSLGNSLSKVKFSGVSGWIEAPVTYNPEIVLENAGYDYALQLTDGNSPNNSGYPNRTTNIKKLSGSGTLCRNDTKGAAPALKVYDASGFTGSIDTSSTSGGLIVIFCEEETEFTADIVAMFIDTGKNKSIYVASGKTVTLDSSATWTAATGFMVEGTLNADGTLASSHETQAVSGSGKVVFTGRAPTVSGDAWWKNEAWTGTVTVKSVTNLRGNSGTGTYIVFNDCGNAGSVIELDSVSGWINPGYTCTVPLKITGTLSLTDGYSDKANAFKVGTLLGSGSISGSGNAPRVVFNVTADWSGFTGTIGLNNKCVVFGETIPDTITSGQIYVSEGAVVTNVNSAANAWWAVGGIKVDGELCSPNLTRFGSGTTITTGDNGVFTLTNATDIDDVNTDYARIQGTGTLKFEGTGYRTISTNNFPTAMVVENNLASGLIHKLTGKEVTIGSLSGNGKIRSDWGNGDRNLKVLQSVDTTYSGLFDAEIDRLGTFTVAPGEATAGTLTLSGAQTASNGLAVEANAFVNLTGTWIGATTVAGTFGGTGTLTGDLTFEEGSKLKVWESDANGLVVTGAITYPDEGKVTVDVSELESIGGDLVILTASDESVTVNADKFTLADGTAEGYSLSVNDDGNLVLTAPAAIAYIGSPLDYTLYYSVAAVSNALNGLSGNQVLTVLGAFTADSLTVKAGLNLTIGVYNQEVASVSVGTFNVAGGLTLNSTAIATAVVLTDSDATCTVKSTFVESVTVSSGVEGKVVSESEDSNPVYTLVDPPAYPSYITPENQAKYTAWATYAGVTTAAEAEGLEEAYLLNCLPSEVEVAKAAFKITGFYQDSEGTWVVVTTTSYNERSYNGTVTVKRYSDVACTTESATGTFFRASLD